jgi:K+-transporting ATPase ATPase B chain
MSPVSKSKRSVTATITDPAILIPAIAGSFKKLDPRLMVKNPVMFAVEVVAALTTVLFIRDIVTGAGHYGFSLQIIVWLWFTVLFANFAEAVAEGRGKAQAASLRAAKTDVIAKKLSDPRDHEKFTEVPAVDLKQGDVVYVSAGDLIPSDGDVIEGVASVNEAAITGESAPVIRESGGDRSAVTGGTKVLSDWIKVRVTSNPGETFLDRMIGLVEGAERRKTPNEIALNILLAGLTIVFLLAVVTLQPLAVYSGAPQSVFVLVSLLVCLIPTTIGGLCRRSGSPAWIALQWKPGHVGTAVGRQATCTRSCSTRRAITLAPQATRPPLPGVTERGRTRPSWPRCLETPGAGRSWCSKTRRPSRRDDPT